MKQLSRSQFQVSNKLMRRAIALKRRRRVSSKDDSDVQGARSSGAARFPGEHESLRKSARGRAACSNTRHVRPQGGHDGKKLQQYGDPSRRRQVTKNPIVRSLLCGNCNNSGHPCNVADFNAEVHEDEQLYAHLTDGKRVVWNVRKLGFRSSPTQRQEHFFI